MPIFKTDNTIKNINGRYYYSYFLVNQNKTNANTNLFGQQATKPANVLQFLSGSKPTHAAFPVGEGV